MAKIDSENITLMRHKKEPLYPERKFFLLQFTVKGFLDINFRLIAQFFDTIHTRHQINKALSDMSFQVFILEARIYRDSLSMILQGLLLFI